MPDDATAAHHRERHLSLVPAPVENPTALDLARGELYRLIDAIARAPARARPALFREFERAWSGFRDELRRGAEGR